jgi:hypothetical protein
VQDGLAEGDGAAEEEAEGDLRMSVSVSGGVFDLGERRERRDNLRQG